MCRLIFISMLAITSVILVACGGTSTPTDATAAKPVNIKVESNPNPAMMGDAELVFTITDADAKPIEGAKVDVSADHTDMTGMGMSGPATDQGGGKYAINANFQHSGNWKLTVYVRKEGLDYKEDIDFIVQ
jgi:YtkA-like